MQPAIFHPRALEAIRAFPAEARRAVGEAILDLQHGAHLDMPLSRPMPAAGSGVRELRVKDAAGAYRVFYVLRSRRGVIVFHAFEKRTQQTPPREIALARQRLREMVL